MRYLLLSLTLVPVASGRLFAQEEFAPAVRIVSGGEPIDVAGYRSARPFLGDFDGDGLNDLLVGQDEDSRLRVYRNRGTNEQPRFDGCEYFRADGEIAELPGGGEFRPQLVDFDGDGNLDLLTSSGPYIFWYKGHANGNYDDPELLKLANGHVLLVGTYGACHAADWEGDGDLDLILVGQRSPDARESDVEFVENTGSPQAPSLPPPVPFKVDDEALHLRGIYSCPFVADWNGDEHQDLLIGLSDGSVKLYENKGRGPTPTLAPPRELVARAVGGRQAEENGAIERSRGGCLCVADWDHDGTLDILIGDQQSETIPPQLTDEKEQLEKTRQAAAQVLREYRQMRRLVRKLGETDRKAFVQQTRASHADRIKELRAEIAALEQAMQPERVNHSYIWLLRRKTPEKSR